MGAYRVVSLERPAGTPTVAFVGRDDELRRLTAVYDAAVAAPAGRLAVILGSPGLGKSRLIHELGRRMGDRATVLNARCGPGAATFAPLVEAIRTLLDLDDAAGADAVRVAIDTVVGGDDAAERARIAGGVAALVAGTPVSPEETFFAVRRFLAALAATQPVVLALDDLQWAEPLLLDLTEHLIQWSTGVPLLVVVAARPELRDTRSSLATPGGLVTDVVTLGGLDAGAATRLAANVIGAEELPAAVAGRVLATSEGNPLFVSELVRMLVHDGALKREGDRWTVGTELAKLEMPPTIHALLAARIERLPPEERLVLERASVVGRQFSRAAVAHLLPREMANLPARIESLRRSELIEPDTGWFLGEPVLRFHHLLIRDAAYRRLLKGTRAELHGRFADWLEARVGDAVEHDETIGWHLEQAHQHLRELGPLDEAGRALGERAARHLGAAGRRALARDDVPLAAGLLGRAIDRLDPDDAGRADLALDWCEALLAAGDVGPATGAVEELGRFAGGSERLRAWHTCFAGQLAVLTDPQTLHATAEAVAAAGNTLASVGDAAGEAKAHSVHATALGRLGQVGASEAALDRALAAARRAHDRRRANAVLAGAPLAALWGPSGVTRASGRCLDVVRVLRITHGAPAVEAVALSCQAVLEALRGRSEAARRMIASSRRMVEELGIMHRLLEIDVFAGLIELLEGDAVAAERLLRVAYEGLRDHGLAIDAAQAAALLGRALLVLGRAADAETLSRESETLAGDDLQAAIAWRGVRAEALSRHGEHAAAVELARAAVEIAAATDALLHHADARLALAVALRAAGRTAEGDAEEARALELWEAKGATLLAERARRDTGRAAPAELSTADRAEPTGRPVRRRVRANAATEHTARLDAAIVAGDADAFPSLVADEMEIVDHRSGVYDRDGALTTYRSLLRVRDLVYRHESLATLGDSLVLGRLSVSASGPTGGNFDVGPYEHDHFDLVEVDAQGRRRRAEHFAQDRLGDAIVRLYERYAELLPEGPERIRAAAVARSVAGVAEMLDDTSLRVLFAEGLEYVDHRRLVLGFGGGADEYMQAVRARREVGPFVGLRFDDVLAGRPDALLARLTYFGNDLTGGGSYETQWTTLWAFDTDGRLCRVELFDSSHEDEALVRFDELTGATPWARTPVSRHAPERHRRRVQPNAATTNAARIDAAIAARDPDALPTLYADTSETMQHPSGATWDRRAALAGWRGLLRAQDPALVHEPLATLGDSLAICRQSLSFRELPDDDIGPFGAVETDSIVVIEVNAEGRRQRSEFFAAEKLSDAMVRLYERYADLLPAGPARDRAAATARSIAVMSGPYDGERIATALAPDLEVLDRRTLGFDSTRGIESIRRGFRALSELADDVESRVDDVLAVRLDAILWRRTRRGLDRAGGGRFESPMLSLTTFGPDGLVSRIEQFDPERVAEALARFDELTAESARGRTAAAPARGGRKHESRVRPNLATANAARLDAAVAARDADAIGDLYAAEAKGMEHHTGAGAAIDRRGALYSYRSLLRAEGPMSRHEPLATLGDALALCLVSTSASAYSGENIDVGSYDREDIGLFEVDASGRRRWCEFFAVNRLGDGVARLYERYAELLPAGPARDRAAGTARSLSAMLGPVVADRWAKAVAPDIEFIDHRLIGLGRAHGSNSVMRGIPSLLETTDESQHRIDEVLDLRSDALLARWTNFGTIRGGGPYERPYVQLVFFGDQGLVTRLEQFDADRDTEALARFDELTAAPLRARMENAATRAGARFAAAWRARDWEGFAANYAPEFRRFDRRAMVLLELDRDDHFAFMRPLYEMDSSRIGVELLATRGDRLALERFRFEGTDRSMGPTVIEHLVVTEVNDRGELVATVVFDLDDVDAAYAEIDRRYASGEAAAFGEMPHLQLVEAFPERDWEAFAAAYTPDFVMYDHRPLGWDTMNRATYVESLRTLVEMAPDVRFRVDHVKRSQRAVFVSGMWVGTREGGAFEAPRSSVMELDARGRICRIDLYNLDQLDAALARFAELRPDPLRIPPNAAMRACERHVRALEARDWKAQEAWIAPGFILDDRRRGILLTFDRDQLIAGERVIAKGETRRHPTVLATAGDRLVLEHVRFTGPGDAVDFEIENLSLTEIDAEERYVAVVAFDADDRRAANKEMLERFARGEAASIPFDFQRALVDRDLDRCRAVLPDDFVFDDHRRTGMGRLEGADEYIAAMAALFELSPDVLIEVMYYVAVEKHGFVAVAHTFGTLAATGGEFEFVVVQLAHVRDGQPVGGELFEIEDIDAALARFVALRPPAAEQRATSARR